VGRLRRPDALGAIPDALLDLTAAAVAADAAIAGEIRIHGPNPHPDIQASLFLLRRDVYDDPAIPPPLNCGSPAYRLQRAVIDRGGIPAHPYVHATTLDPSFMGVHGGGAIWAATEAGYAHWLDADGEPALLDLLAERLGRA
jgi:hypothetical protein